jgi:hypothetical protein
MQLKNKIPESKIHQRFPILQKLKLRPPLEKNCEIVSKTFQVCNDI